MNTTANALATTVQIPGQVYVTYHEGRIVKVAFVPSASNAGYFGPAAVLEEGDENLDLESTDGPFWKAVQAHLSTTHGNIGWEE